MRNGLPTLFSSRDFVDAGGLMSSYTNWTELRRRTAVYVDKILKGAKPADLPVEQPAKFELVMNLKTAKVLGLTIPQSVLVLADQVIPWLRADRGVRRRGVLDFCQGRGAMATRGVLTYKDYEALPTDGRRYELHEGEIFVTPAPSPCHQRVIGRLFVVLHHHMMTRGLGEVFVSPIDCILSETTVVQPDIVYVEARRATAVSSRGIEGAPTLAVEVLSPSTVQIDREVKLQVYARYGLPHYWIVDPEARSIEAYALAEGAYQLAMRLEGFQPAALPPFPALVLDPASLWP